MNWEKLYDLPSKVTVKKVLWLKQRLNYYYVTMTLQKKGIDKFQQKEKIFTSSGEQKYIPHEAALQ